MNPTKTLFPLAALLLCLPAMGQEDGQKPDPKPAPKTIHFEVQASADGFAAILLAPDDRLMQFGNQVVLADGNLVLLTKKEQGKFAYDMEIPVEVTSDLHWQAVTWDSAKGLQIKAPQKIELDSAAHSPVVNRIPVPGKTAPSDARIPDARIPVGQIPVGQIPVGQSDADRQPLPADAKAGPVYDENGDEVQRTGIGLTVREADDGTGYELRATFEAPTDGYGLRVLRVDWSGESATVYLYRKLPGAGEGMLDVVEQHEATAHLGTTQKLIVWLAEGTKPKPGGDLAFRLLAEMER